jgi:glycosyltransferase involved in cell wall biosynthesis
MNNPLVSIITVTYNASDSLEQTMQSVFTQTYPNIEYIIIDGASTDGTIDIIKKQEARLALWLSEKDEGIYDAMNKGIRLAKGEFIGMINAGDYYEPDAVETVVNAYLGNRDTDIFHGNMNLLNSDGTFFKLKKPNTNLDELYKGISLFHTTFFVTSATYKTHGLYDTRFKVSADFDFALRCHLAGVHFFYIDKVIANFRLGGFSYQSKNNGILDSRNVLLKNGYPAETVVPIVRQWKISGRRKQFFNAVYKLLRTLLPQPILNKISRRISLK